MGLEYCDARKAGKCFDTPESCPNLELRGKGICCFKCPAPCNTVAMCGGPYPEKGSFGKE